MKELVTRIVWQIVASHSEQRRNAVASAIKCSSASEKSLQAALFVLCTKANIFFADNPPIIILFTSLKV